MQKWMHGWLDEKNYNHLLKIFFYSTYCNNSVYVNKESKKLCTVKKSFMLYRFKKSKIGRCKQGKKRYRQRLRIKFICAQMSFI